MDRLLALCLDPETGDAIRAQADAWGVRLVEQGAGVGQPRQLDRAEELIAVLVGEVPDPIQAAQRAHLDAPHVPVVLLTAAEDCRRITDELRFAPFVGSDVRCVPHRPTEDLLATLRVTVERSRQRDRHRRTIGLLNERIAERPAGTARAAALLGKLMDVAPIGVGVADDDGLLRALNPRGAHLLAAADARLIGRRLDELVRRSDRERLHELLARLDGDPETRPTETFELQNGRIIELTGARLTPASGGPGLLLLIEDVSQRQALVAQLTAANRRKDEFLALLGHELRNPLAPIRTAVDLMRLRGDRTVERERTIIERHVDHMVQLVDDLLDVSRITRGKLVLDKAPINVSSFVASAIEMVSPLLEQRRHALHLDVPRSLRLLGDHGRMAQVVSNLLSNAARYTGDAAELRITAWREDDVIRLSVRDNGPGIPPELLPDLFDLFVQGEQSLSRERGGLGIGLAVVRSLVELHGGTVTVESEVGVGSEFVITLPALPDAPEAATSREASAVVAPEGGSTRVLVVDDNVDAADLLGTTLEALGYQVAVAHDAPAALTVARSFRPDISLIDIGLPVMDGHELASHLRELPGLEQISLAAVTGYGQDSDRARSAEAGFSEHLVKPIALEQLRAAMARLAGHRRGPA